MISIGSAWGVNDPTYNSDRETVPETSESNLGIDAAHGASEAFAWSSFRIELADHDIGWVRDNGAKNTGHITTNEGDTGLRPLSIVRLLSWEVGVDGSDNVFERGEFHHSVGDLSAPKRIETLVQSASVSGKRWRI